MTQLARLPFPGSACKKSPAVCTRRSAAAAAGPCRISCQAQSSCSTSAAQDAAPQADATRRALCLAAPLALLLSRAGPAAADAEASTSAAPPPASSSSSMLEPFLENDFSLSVPSSYTYLEAPLVVPERGPAPERSPVLARFEAGPGRPGVISVLTRKAQAFKQTLLQVSDISQLGSPVEVAKLILPRGSTLLAANTTSVEQPPKDTPLGPVDIPPQTYYTYEFTTNTGLHVAMAAAAKRGSVLICGASTSAEEWVAEGSVLRQVASSFRIRSQPMTSIS